MDIKKIQKLLNEYRLDGWIFTDYHGHDFISRDFLEHKNRFCTRRMFYFIPKDGEPIKLLSAIEPLLLDHLPGEKRLYKGKNGLNAELAKMLSEGAKIAVQYSEGGMVPTICSMDGGTVDLLRGFGVELVSSADLMQYFGAVLTQEQIKSHKKAGEIIHRILDNTFKWIRKSINEGIYIDEWAMLKKMEELISSEPVYMDSPPFFGVDDHACDPGYEPRETGSYQIKEGSRIIIDIAGRLPEDDAVYYDISWCMNVGTDIDPEYKRLFETVRDARQTAFDFIQNSLKNGKRVRGCDVDEAVQIFLKNRGLAQYIMHRTGHNIGHRCHGVGANLDNFETKDIRSLLPGTMFSVEPGVYTEKYGVRLEYDVHITSDRQLQIYGPIQNEILVI